MKTTHTLFLMSALVLCFSYTSAHAEASPKTCLSFSSNVSYGATDTHTDGDVSRLQSFLVTQGYFSQSNMGTLHFGPLTLKAVEQFQAANGVPATGFVGPLTRAAIQKASCGATPPSTTVSLYSLTPAKGAVGTEVSVTGFGFTNNNTILMDGSVAARNVPIASSVALSCTTSPTCHGGINQTLTFSIPSSLSPDCKAGMACPMYMRLTSPGTYSVTVENENGTSSALPLRVTSN